MEKTAAPSITEAMLERGKKQLKRVEMIVDVIYGIMIFQLFLALPRPEIEGFNKDTILQAFGDHAVNFLVVIVGIILILLYWNLSNLQFGNLARSNATHASLSILQMFCLLVYLYFVRLDVELEGVGIALLMESIFLALAGFLGVYGWHYAETNNLSTGSMTLEERDKAYLKMLPEPITSVLTIPFAFLGPNIWTVSWLLMIPVSIITKHIRQRLKKP